MNFQRPNFKHVEPPPAQYRYPTRRASSGSKSRAPPQLTFDRPENNNGTLRRASLVQEYAANSHTSLSPQPSVVRFAPSLSSYSSSRSSDNITALERQQYIRGRNPPVSPPMANPTGARTSRSQFTPEQLQAMAMAQQQQRQQQQQQRRQLSPTVPMAGRPAEEFRDPLALEAARVTPGIDDTPYIQYAIEALTREREGESSNPSSMSSDARPLGPATGRGYYTPHANAPVTQQPAAASPTQDVMRQNEEQRAPLLAETGRRPSSPRSSMSTLVKGKEKGTRLFPQRPTAPDAWEPVDPELFRDGREKINPRLVFKPKILRTTSMIMLMTLCLMMLAALIFSAIYSQRHTGLWDYVGSIDSGQYFLMRVVPAMVGAIILLWAQYIVVTMLRMRPFARLAAADKAARLDAIFDDLYPRSFLRPQIVGPWQVWVPNSITWLAYFTLPLQSCLFTVVWTGNHWRWATVQGVAWTLVALYLLLVGAIGIQLAYWLRGRTGVMWDPRSIADVAAIVANSNSLDDYRQTEILGTREQLKRVLYRRRTDRLAYWGWADRERSEEIWYGLGYQDEEGTNPYGGETVEGFDEKGRPAKTHDADPWGDVEVEGTAMTPRVRYRHLPFCLKNLPLIIFISVGFFLLILLFVACFIPETRISTKGFLPQLSAAPGPGAFSAADFLYSFLPALIGLIMFVAFQDLDLHLRILQPWGELSAPPAGGALPEASILADYAACYPVQATIHALRNRHWRVAFISLCNSLFVLIPVFAGGMFLALTPADGPVRIYPQIPLFAIALSLTIVYWLALVALYPRRQQFRLPHGVTCLAEIISFVAGDDCVRDEAFVGMIRNKTSLVGKLGVENRRDEEKPRWTLHTGGGGARDDRLGVRRVRRFTERRSRGSLDPAAAGLMTGASGGRRASSGGGGGGGGEGTLLLPQPMSRREARRDEREGGVRVSPQYVFVGREG